MGISLDFMAAKKSPKQEVFYLEINPEIRRKGFLQESELYKEREVLQKYLARKFAKNSVLYLFFAFLAFRLVVFVEFLIAGLRIKTDIWLHLLSNLSFLMFYILLAVPIYISVYLFTIKLVQEQKKNRLMAVVLNLVICAMLFLPFYLIGRGSAGGAEHTDLFFAAVLVFETLYLFVVCSVILGKKEVRTWEDG